MTVVARRIIATPVRSASETWAVIVGLLAPQSGSEAHQELLAVGGIACSLITDETLKNAPAVVYGSGPRVHLYYLYDKERHYREKAPAVLLADVEAALIERVRERERLLSAPVCDGEFRCRRGGRRDERSGDEL